MTNYQATLLFGIAFFAIAVAQEVIEARLKALADVENYRQQAEGVERALAPLAQPEPQGPPRNSWLHDEPDSCPSPCVFTVCIRKDYGKPVRPEALQLDGNSYAFERGWTMDADDPYPGEVAWIPRDPAYPSDAPTWIASGDLKRCPIKEDNQ